MVIIGGGIVGLTAALTLSERRKLVDALTELTYERDAPIVVEGDAAPIDLNGAVYEYEPSEEEILETLLPRNLTTQILAALYENQAGFFGSQMAAMDNATRNAGDLINKLTIQYNRSRQAAITTELVEIISGAEAL